MFLLSGIESGKVEFGAPFFRKLKFLDMGGEQQLLNREKIFVKEVSEGWFLQFRVCVIGFRNIFGDFSVFVSSQVVPFYFIVFAFKF